MQYGNFRHLLLTPLCCNSCQIWHETCLENMPASTALVPLSGGATRKVVDADVDSDPSPTPSEASTVAQSEGEGLQRHTQARPVLSSPTVTQVLQ